MICKSNIQKQGYDFLPCSLRLSDAIYEALGLWKVFCLLPEYSKKRVPYEGDDVGIGYELKQDFKCKGKKKENFDIASLYQIPNLNFANSLMRNITFKFFSKAQVLVKLIEPAIVNVLKELDLIECEFIHFVRFIHYFDDAKAGDCIALPHIDKGGITLHLFESVEGFEFLSYVERAWQKVLIPNGSLMVMPSMQIQHESKGKFRALCHRVTAAGNAVGNERFAVVCFVRFTKTAKYNKDKFGSLQTLLPGFNYDISHKEFSTFLRT